MNNINVMQGLTIMLRYTGVRGEVNATHDRIYAGPEADDADTIADDDVQALERYGWAFDEDIERWYLD